MTLKSLDTWIDAIGTSSYDEQSRLARQTKKGKRAGGSNAGGSATSLSALSEKIAQFLASFYHQVWPHCILMAAVLSSWQHRDHLLWHRSAVR